MTTTPPRTGMTIPSMQLNAYEKLLWESGMSKGRHERGVEVIGKITAVLASINEREGVEGLNNAVSILTVRGIGYRLEVQDVCQNP